MASAASPATSPRLPSPPPMAEDQIGPLSPNLATSFEEKGKSSAFDPKHAAARRIRPGSKFADIAEGPPLVDLGEIDSAFQLTEHLQALHNHYTHPPDSISTHPLDRSTSLLLAQPPNGVDRALWLYELCRFLIQKVNSIIVALFADEPPCSSATCPEMRASEWQYLCAVHDPPKSCCAIDYCCHTLDWAANVLTSPKHFPSRLSLGTESTNVHQQVRQLTNVFRRVYRIFAHAWFQHRDMFWKVEGRTGLYVFFKTVCDVYALIPEDNYTIPAEAEGEGLSGDVLGVTDAGVDVGGQKPEEGQEQRQGYKGQPTILRKDRERERERHPHNPAQPEERQTTKRHRQTASRSGGDLTLGAGVATVPEENEPENETEEREGRGAPLERMGTVQPRSIEETQEHLGSSEEEARTEDTEKKARNLGEGVNVVATEVPEEEPVPGEDSGAGEAAVVEPIVPVHEERGLEAGEARAEEDRGREEEGTAADGAVSGEQKEEEETNGKAAAEAQGEVETAGGSVTESMGEDEAAKESADDVETGKDDASAAHTGAHESDSAEVDKTGEQS